MKSPAPVDPYATAQAQSQMNKDTATFQSGLNMVNQITPYGNLTYSGKNDGQPGSATATTSLSPTQQTLLDQSQQADLKQNQIGLNQLDKVGGILSNPVDLNNTATEDRLSQLGRARLDPQFAQEKQQLEQSLTDKGVRLGSEAYGNAMKSYEQSKNDAYNQLYLNGRQQAVQEALTERNQPLNEITGLLNGQQISLPQFQQTPQTQVANTDLSGLVMQAAKMKQDSANATAGGLFGLGSAALGGVTALAGMPSFSMFGTKFWGK